MCLQICLSYLMLRQRRGTRSICSWERRIGLETGLETAAGGAVLAVTIKALLMLLGFFQCYSNCKAALFFPPPAFPHFLLSPRTAVKISFAELFQQIIPNSLPPLIPGAALLLRGGHQHCSRWQIQLPGFCIFIYITRTNPLWTYYLKL